MSFGGSIKLTGEQEYRNAIKQITSDLGKMSDALETQAQDFTKSDKGLLATARDQKKLTEAIQQQKDAVNQAKASYQGYAVQLEAQKTRHNALTKEYRDAVKELDRIKKESGETSEEYQKQAKAVDKLEEELTQSNIEMDESKSAMSALKKEIASGQAAYQEAERAIDGLGKETEESGNKAREASDGFSVWKGVLADLTSTAIKGAIDGLKNLGGAFVDMGKQALQNYADFEQLEGGVQKLFGDDMTAVVKNANDAFKTAGMDANTYMETVTGFSASLISGLGGDTSKAAELADQAVRDMADNANTFGTSMDSLQAAYSGFAKGNYTMLDSLKLGYGGSASEMLRLVKDAGVVEDSVESMNDVSFDQMIEAIGIVQKNMNITGTTANEASKTIEGSMSAASAAWQNFLTGLGSDNADFGQLIDNLMTSVEDLAANIIPRVQTIISSIGEVMPELMGELVPQIMEMVPPLLDQSLPILMDAITGLISSALDILPQITGVLGDLIPQVVQTLIGMIPQLIDAGVQLLLGLVDGLTEAMPQLISMVPQIISSIVTTLSANLPQIITTGVKLLVSLIKGIVSALPQLIATIPQIIRGMVSTFTALLPQILTVGRNIIQKLKDGVMGAIGLVTNAASQIGSRIISTLSKIPSRLISIGTNLVKGIWNGISNATSWIIGKIRGFGDSVVKGIKSIFGIHSPSTVMEEQVGKYLAQGIGVGFEDEMKAVASQMQSAIPTSFDVNSSVTGSGSYFGMVEAFKQALTEVKIELDDEVAGRFVDKTVTRLIYT